MAKSIPPIAIHAAIALGATYIKRKQRKSQESRLLSNHSRFIANLRNNPTEFIREYQDQVMGISHTAEIKNLCDEIESSTEWNSGWLSKVPYNERKFLWLVEDFEGYGLGSTPHIQRFRISHIPKDITFSNGMPLVNELYIAHPYNAGHYIPVNNYEHSLLRDRIHEMSQLMMALGATELKTVNTDGYNFSSNNQESSNSSGSVGWNKFGAALSALAATCNSSEYKLEHEIKVNFEWKPKGKPYLPENLVWYPHEKEWQQIAEMRLHGNLTKYEIKISSKQNTFVSSNERRQINAEAKTLFFSAEGSHSSSSSYQFKEEASKSAIIAIKFK